MQNWTHAERLAPGLLRLLLSGKLVCVCVCVCPPLRVLIIHVKGTRNNQLNQTLAVDKLDERGLSNTCSSSWKPGTKDKVDAVQAIEGGILST